MTGRLIVGKNSNRLKKNPNKSQISHVDENNPWASVKSTVYTRMNNQQILTLMFTYPDRWLNFVRYTEKLDRAIEKIDKLLEQNPNSDLLSRKKYLLRTGKDIFQKVSQNFETYKPDGQLEENQMSLLQYGRQMLKKMMRTLSTDQRNMAESISSDSEDGSIEEEYDAAFEKVLNDYFNTDISEKGRLQKRIEYYLYAGDRSMEANCDAYRKLIVELKEKITVPMTRRKNLEYQARLFLVIIAHSTLRQAASSSCIERKFSDALRSTERRRAKLTAEHIGAEVFLRSCFSEKEALSDLCRNLGYDSKNFNRMMISLNTMEDEYDKYDVSFTIDEEKTIYNNFFFSSKNFKHMSPRKLRQQMNQQEPFQISSQVFPLNFRRLK